MPTPTTVVLRQQYTTSCSQSRMSRVFDELKRQGINMAAVNPIEKKSSKECNNSKKHPRTSNRIVVGPSTTNDDTINKSFEIILHKLRVKYHKNTVLQQLLGTASIGVPGVYGTSYKALRAKCINIKASYVGEGSSVSVIGFFWYVPCEERSKAITILLQF